MADHDMHTKWCLQCGGEFVASIDECPDCELPLVDEPPEMAPDADRAGTHVAYDLAEWAVESRIMLEQLVEAADVPRAWEGTTLVVPGAFERRVDQMVQQVEVTTLPTLDPDAERVAYDLKDWTDSQHAMLQRALDNATIAFEYDQDGDLVVVEDDQAKVEALIDEVEEPGSVDLSDFGLRPDVFGDLALEFTETGDAATGLTATGDAERGDRAVGEDGVGEGRDGDDEADGDAEGEDEGEDGAIAEVGYDDIDAAAVLSDLYVAADRLQKKATSHDGVLGLIDATDQAARIPLPYGFSPALWRDIVGLAEKICGLIDDDDSTDSEIEEQSRLLRDTLRQYV